MHPCRKPLFILLLFLLVSPGLFSQQVFYEDTFNGGVVTGGYGLGTATSGTGSWTVSIPAGSTIRRAYLLAGRIGPVASYTVTLNGTNHTFSTPGNQVSPDFTTIYASPSAVHAIDVTSSISAATTNYTLVCPTTGFVSNKFAEFYLWIAFDNPSLPLTSAVLYIQNYNVASPMTLTLNTTNSISSSNPVGFATVGGFANMGTTDCQNVSINGTAIGAWAGRDFNAATNYGSIGAFGYWNNTLVGFGDDTPNATINGPYNLADISSYVATGSNSVTVWSQHCPTATTSMDNHTWMMALAYSGSTVLSAEISALRAELTPERDVRLDWLSYSEKQHDFFEIERNQDGVTFGALGRVEGWGTTEVTHEYSFLDTQPVNGGNFYRLKLVDQNGKVEYSEIREVSLEPLALNRIYPNPANDELFADLSLLDAGKVIWSLTDLMGKELARQEAELPKGSQTLRIPVSGFAAGSYLLKIGTANGRQITRSVRIKN